MLVGREKKREMVLGACEKEEEGYYLYEWGDPSVLAGIDTELFPMMAIINMMQEMQRQKSGHNGAGLGAHVPEGRARLSWRPLPVFLITY